MSAILICENDMISMSQAWDKEKILFRFSGIKCQSGMQSKIHSCFDSNATKAVILILLLNPLTACMSPY